MKIALLVILVGLYFAWRVAHSNPQPNRDKRTNQATQDSINDYPAQPEVTESLIDAEACDQLKLYLYVLH